MNVLSQLVQIYTIIVASKTSTLKPTYMSNRSARIAVNGSDCLLAGWSAHRPTLKTFNRISRLSSDLGALGTYAISCLCNFIDVTVNIHQ